MPFDRQANVEAVQDFYLLIPSMTCAGCMTRVEQCLNGIQGVQSARVNLSNHSAQIRAQPDQVDAEILIAALADQGYAARPFDPSHHGAAQTDTMGRDLLLRLGVAGFAAMNVMLLSISVWSGAEAAVRDLLHWVSALIALPAIAFAGQPFFASAWRALKAKRLNMDVPISLAIVLAAAHSVTQTAGSAEHAYFDAGVMLLFFLLIGRYLEHRTRATARSAAAELLAMTGRSALRVMPDGTRAMVHLSDLKPGMIIEVAPGERIPADGTISQGRTELDRALITGESRPETAKESNPVYAGMLNLTGAIRVNITATGDQTLLAEIARMIDAAERGRTRYDRIADRAARIYAPMVHILAAGAFLWWAAVSGQLQTALEIAVAVLIVTCPCALALAVPTVHTVASARLFRRGIFLKDGAELERLADIDMVVFDKTGTLTDGVPQLVNPPDPTDPAWAVAAALASRSRHPLSKAIAATAKDLGIVPADVQLIQERPGLGIEGVLDNQPVRLGRMDWDDSNGNFNSNGTALILPDRKVWFAFDETLRQGAVETCDTLRGMGLDLAILSGDQAPAVDKIAAILGIETALAALKPDEKLAWLQARRAEGRKVLMIGDGLNDGPALAAAHASMSPASAIDVAKTAAGLVFTGDNVKAVVDAYRTARTAKRRAFESFGIAIAYNSIAIPLAMAGYVTPLLAALAMSGSSVLVILNALRQGGTT